MIPPDKIQHYFYGQVAFLAAFLLSGNSLFAISVCTLIAIGKEMYDSTGRGNVEVFDALATILGGLVLMVFV